jgi:hypothetical protein
MSATALADPGRRGAVQAERILFKTVLLFGVLWPFLVLAAPSAIAWERFYDAENYRHFGQEFLNGANLYQSIYFRQWPAVAALCAPLTLLPPPVASVLMAALCMAGGLLGLAGAHARLRRQGLSPGRLCLAATAFGPPFLMLFYVGQMTGLCFAAYGAGLLLIDRRPRLAGLCFALMAAKPHLALIALPALIASGPAAIVAFGLGVLGWPAASLLFGGVDGLVAFAWQLLRVGGAGTLQNSGVSLPSLLRLQGQPLAVAQALCLAALLVFLGRMALLRRRGAPSGPGDVDAAAALVLVLIPYGMMYDLIFVSPLLLRLGSTPDRRSGALLAGWWLTLLLTLLLVDRGGGSVLGLVPVLAATLWLTRGRARPTWGLSR